MQELPLTLTYDYPEAFQQAIQQSTKGTRIQVDIEILECQEQRALTNVAVQKTGPDISAGGKTWISNLVSLQAMRPFDDNELKKFGEDTTFVKGNWESEILNNQSYGIPWQGDIQVINAGVDLLKKAGVKRKTTFISIENLCTLVGKLHQLEGVVPWMINTARDSMLIRLVASWLWNAAGHLFSSHGHRTMFRRLRTLSATKGYFVTLARQSHQIPAFYITYSYLFEGWLLSTSEWGKVFL